MAQLTVVNGLITIYIYINNLRVIGIILLFITVLRAISAAINPH
jgi:hypothetical protein